MLIHLSLGDYVDVILLLLRAEMHERAALFARAASAEGVLTDDMKPGLLCLLSFSVCPHLSSHVIYVNDFQVVVVEHGQCVR